MFKETLDEHQKILDELSDKANAAPVITGDGSIDVNALRDLFAPKDQFNQCFGIVRGLEALTDGHTEKLADLYDKIGELTTNSENHSNQIGNLDNTVAQILANMNKDGPVIVAPVAKDSSADVQKLNEQMFALKNELALKLNIKDFDEFRRDLKLKELD